MIMLLQEYFQGSISLRYKRFGGVSKSSFGHRPGFNDTSTTGARYILRDVHGRRFLAIEARFPSVTLARYRFGTGVYRAPGCIAYPSTRHTQGVLHRCFLHSSYLLVLAELGTRLVCDLTCGALRLPLPALGYAILKSHARPVPSDSTSQRAYLRCYINTCRE